MLRSRAPKAAALGAVLLALVVAAWAGDIRTTGRFVSTVGHGTAPLEVDSTTMVENLNAELLQGMTPAELSGGGEDDGVVIITQEKALEGGVTAGDPPGFPVVISAPGSYRLGSNLDISGLPGAEDIDVIAIGPDRVTLDLNGFSLIGPTSCSGTPLVCLPSGTGLGINGFSLGSSFHLVVRNGFIRGMGATGIIGDRTLVVENVHVAHNRAGGVIIANPSGIVRDSVAMLNGGNGFSINGTIEGSTSILNGVTGIFANPGSRVSGNVVRNNQGDGIRCAGCVLVDNAVTSNGGFGIDLSFSAGWGRNVLLDNVAGDVTGTGLQLDVNACTGVACP